MSKSEYRRALIMLRPLASGCAGHVRLERRVMMGSMDFIVTAAQGADRLFAALAGRRGDEVFAAPLGPLRRDRRGQATLAWSFDPRNIAGRPLDAYSLIAVVRAGEDGCRMVLAGNVEGARPMDMAQVEAAVCGLFRAEEEPAADLPELGEAKDGTKEEDAGMAIADSGRQGALTPAEAEAETRIFTRSRPREERRVEAVTVETPPPEVEVPQTEVTETADAQDGETAARALGVDLTEPWTGALEPLKALFLAQPPVATLEDDFIYISAPLAGGDGECRVGLHVAEGRVDAVRYAVPALHTPEPPQGLEAYAWAGNDTHGYWVLTVDPQTGA